MAEAYSSPDPDFTALNRSRTVIYDAGAVPDTMWEHAQELHGESLRALLPVDEHHRVDAIVHTGNPEAYRDSRIDPNILVGNDWNDDQLFRRPKFVATIGPRGNLKAGMFTADNSSARASTPKLLRPAEYRTKMLLPPGLPVPVVGNRRFLHLREVFADPHLPNRDRTALALSGLYHATADARQKQPIAAYVIPTDPADLELTRMAEMLGMIETDQRPHSFQGYSEEAEVVRVQASVKEVRDRIATMTWARPMLDQMYVEYVNVKI